MHPFVYQSGREGLPRRRRRFPPAGARHERPELVEAVHDELRRNRLGLEWREAETQTMGSCEPFAQLSPIRRKQLATAFRLQPLLRPFGIVVHLNANRVASRRN